MSKKAIILLIVGAVAFIGAIVLYKYRFVSNLWNVSTLGEIPTPIGYERVSFEGDDYAAFLRGLPLKPRGAKVQLYTGGDAKYQFLSAGVIDWPALSNSEQCADMTMRVRAEFLWQSGQYDKIVFTDTQNNKRFYRGGGCKIALYAYLKKMYECCNTASVYIETTASNRPLAAGAIQAYLSTVFAIKPLQKPAAAFLLPKQRCSGSFLYVSKAQRLNFRQKP